MKKNRFVLNRAIHTPEGCELTEIPFKTYEEAVEARKEWFEDVKFMLETAGIEYEVDEDRYEIFDGEDSWDAWIEF